MWKFFFLVVISLCFDNVHSFQSSFTNYANMEKLYTLEDELIALSDIILKQEKSLHGGEDIHNMFDIQGTIERVKDIHRAIVNNKNMTKYIVHPINIYHMTKRLVRDWSNVVKTLEKSKSCAMAMRVKVQNIGDNIPTENHLTNICEGILKLQSLYDISVDDLMSGNIKGVQSQTPLSLDDAFEIARVAHASDQYYLSVHWLKLVTSKYVKEKASFNLTNALSQLSSSYFMLQRPKDALATIDKLLKLDPENVGAKRNKKFYQERSEESQEDKELAKTVPKSKKDRLLQKFCGNYTEKNLKKQSRLFCTYTKERDQDMFVKPAIQTEVLSLKPFIVLFHNMTTYSQQRAVSYLGYQKMRDIMYKKEYSYPEGIEGLVVEDKTHWHWISNLQRKLENIHITNLEPNPAHLIVTNIGMDGYTTTHLSRHKMFNLGIFVVFLSDIDQPGGEVVFPFAKTKVTPQKGSVLFYERKAHKQMTVCPVLGDTEWIGVYPLHDELNKNICHADSIYRPKLK